MQQYLQCFSIQQARITIPKTIQESRLEVAGGHGEHCCSSFAAPHRHSALLFSGCLSAVTLYFCHLQMTRQQKDWAGSALSLSGGVWRTASQCSDGLHAEVTPACGGYPALFNVTAVVANTLTLTRCVGETERLCTQK